MASKSTKPNLEANDEMLKTLSETRSAISKIEGTASNINKIAHEVTMPTEVRVRREPGELSIRFITGILVVLVAVTGMFGALFFHVTSQYSKDIRQLEHRVLVLETKNGIKQPSHNSEK